MTWQPVPWFVAGGVHGPEVARLLAYAATNGAEGVIGISDCKVGPSSPVGSQIAVAPGAVVVLKRTVGATYQSYLARNPSNDVVAVAPTGSDGPRSDLIVAMIEDPEDPGVAEPADPESGPYIFTRVISGVPAGTKRLRDVPGYANANGYALARIDMPANRGVVEAGYIVDLRDMVMPRTHRILRTANIADNVKTTLAAVSPARQRVPVTDGRAAWQVDVPPWAVGVRAVATLAGVSQPGGEASGIVSIRVGSIQLATNGWNNEGVSNFSRTTWVSADDVPVPANVRGTTVTIDATANINSGIASASRPYFDWGTSLILDVEFYEKAL